MFVTRGFLFVFAPVNSSCAPDKYVEQLLLHLGVLDVGCCDKVTCFWILIVLVVCAEAGGKAWWGHHLVGHVNVVASR